MYTHPIHHYAVKYPSEWNLQEEPNVTFSSPNVQITEGGSIVIGQEIVIFVEYNVSRPSLDTLANRLSAPGLNVVKKGEVVVDGLPALWYVAEGPGTDETMTGVMLTSENIVYRIESYYGKYSYKEAEEILKTMLSTLKIPQI